MLKFIGSMVLGLSLLVLVGSANSAPPCHGQAASAPATYQAVPNQASRTVRSYSYEPGARTYSYEPAASYRGYGRSYARPAGGGFNNATTKGRGSY